MISIKNKKGQGALEYLLIIGGAVLIAVIVVALVTGLGRPSRETVQDQAKIAQKSTEQPLSAQIITLTGQECNIDDPTGPNYFIINWQQLDSGGEHTIRVVNYKENEIPIDVGDENFNNFNSILTETRDQLVAIDVIDSEFISCKEVYWVEIINEKSGQQAVSSRARLTW